MPQPGETRSRWSLPAILLAIVLACAPLLPPLGSWAARNVWAESLSFVTFAVAVPALVVLAAPWQLLGLGAQAERLADSRRRHPEILRAATFVVVAATLEILWRTPFAVDHLARNRWLPILEALTLIPAGIALWLEIVDSPPLTPALTPADEDRHRRCLDVDDLDPRLCARNG